MIEKEKIFEISKKIGYKVGIYFNNEEIEVFEKFLEDYKYKSNLIEKQQKEIELKDKIIDEIKWKPISEYSTGKYDWVLVKYYDGDYECVPEVAELRNDNKWHTTERIIPFEVKYFFDMQILDK